MSFFNRIRDFIYKYPIVLVLYWPIYMVIWFSTENLALGRAAVIHSAIDDAIPFLEIFVVFYYLWFPFWIGMALYCFICEKETFIRYMAFFILTFTVANVIYFVFPTTVDLRPTAFERDNIFTWLTGYLYSIDNPTNACPSEHVIGALAVVFAAWDSKRFRRAVWMIPITVVAILICLSILFTKQHSFWDLVAAVPYSFAAWLICFKPWRRKKTEGE